MKMKKDFLGKIVCLVLFVGILTVAAVGFGGRVAHNDDVQKDTTTTNKTESKGEQNNTSATTTQPTTTKPNAKRDDIKSTDKLVCFTFDDGPYSPVTSRILDTFEQYDGRATFFVVGDRVNTYKEQIKRAHDMGCEIGTHTYSHVNLNTLSVDEMREQIDKSTSAISEITGDKVKIIRPPEGAANSTVKENVDMPLVMWSVDSRDWDYRNADKDYQSVMDNVSDGSIVLMHDLYPATAEAVARLVPELAKQGYKFVTFSELMEARGVDVEPGRKYFSAPPQTPTEVTEATADTTAAN